MSGQDGLAAYREDTYTSVYLDYDSQPAQQPEKMPRWRRFVVDASMTARLYSKAVLGIGVGTLAGVGLAATEPVTVDNAANIEATLTSEPYDSFNDIYMPSSLPVGGVRLYSPDFADITFDDTQLNALADVYERKDKIEEKTKDKLAWHLGGSAMVYGSLGGALALHGRKLMTERQQQSIDYILARTGSLGVRGLTASALAMSLVSTPGLNFPSEHPVRITSPNLYGTAFEDLRFGGDIAETIEFYQDAAATGLPEAFHDAIDLRDLPPGNAPEDIIYIFAEADSHCGLHTNQFRDNLIGLYYDELEQINGDIPDNMLHINAGDNYSSAIRPIEKECSEGMARTLKKYGIESVVSDGNHGSYMMRKVQSEQGFEVLDGEVVTIGGLKVLGIYDKVRSNGNGSRPASHEAQVNLERAEGERIGRIACESGEDIDAVLAHRYELALAAYLNSCGTIKNVFAGHTHDFHGPIRLDMADNQDEHEYFMVFSTFSGADTIPMFKRVSSFNAEAYVLPYNYRTDEIVQVHRYSTDSSGVVTADVIDLPDEAILHDPTIPEINPQYAKLASLAPAADGLNCPIPPKA